VSGAHSVDMTQIAVAATAVSRQHTVMVDGWVIGAQLLSETARQWGSQTAEDRVKSIAAAARELDF
jgi:hypothetical protein